MPTIGSSLRASARRTPDAPALKFGDTEFTYRELDAEVDRVANALADLGLVKGERFALMSGNTDKFVIAFYAALRLGAIFVPVNPASAVPELQHIVEDSGASVLVFDPKLTGVVTGAEQAGLAPTLRKLLSLGTSAGHEDLFVLAETASTEPMPDIVDEFDDALILYTSGTTGKAKGALFDHHRMMWVGFICVSTCGMKVGDRFLHVAPMYHAAELAIMLITGTMIGAKHVVMGGFDPVAVLDTLESERITMFFGVPTMFQFLMRLPDLQQRDLSAWRTGMFGAAPMPTSEVEKLVKFLPNVELIQLCGQTEGGPGGIYASYEQVQARPDASGRQALPFTESRVVDDDGNDVEPGGVGELVLRGETIMKCYWNRPDATAETIKDGWLHTGDLARIDEDGYVTLVDRIKDLIITGGRNVYSVEVENAVAAHPDVLEVAVVARPHHEYGESIVAVITPRDGAGPTLEEIRTFCKDRISDYKIPHDIVIAKIPRNPSGKILKRELRESVREAAGSAAQG